MTAVVQDMSTDDAAEADDLTMLAVDFAMPDFAKVDLSVAATCKTVDGVRWCYNPKACGENCTQVCASLGLPLTISDNAWFNAQSTQLACQAINDAFGLGGMVGPLGSNNYACIEDQGSANHTMPGGLIGPLICSIQQNCPSLLRQNQDAFGVACGVMSSRRALCPCQ